MKLFSPLPIENKNEFFDRDKELKIMQSSIGKYSNISIIGERRIGKTSLLKVFLNELNQQDNSNYIPIYSDLQKVTKDITPLQILKKIIRKIYSAAPMGIFTLTSSEWLCVPSRSLYTFRNP